MPHAEPQNMSTHNEESIQSPSAKIRSCGVISTDNYPPEWTESEILGSEIRNLRNDVIHWMKMDRMYDRSKYSFDFIALVIGLIALVIAVLATFVTCDTARKLKSPETPAKLQSPTYPSATNRDGVSLPAPTSSSSPAPRSGSPLFEASDSARCFWGAGKFGLNIGHLPLHKPLNFIFKMICHGPMKHSPR